jgi:DNA-binding XRE family transcriptional regulator
MALSDAQKFRAARAILNWTQDDLAARAGISKASSSQFESGHREMMHNNRLACWRIFYAAGIYFSSSGVTYTPPTTHPTTIPTEEELTTNAG